jgi:hypothetical protein
VFINERDLSSAFDFTDGRNLRKSRRAPKPPQVPARDGEKQFIIVAAVKRHLQRIQF